MPGLAAHGGRFLAARDEVGLGSLLGFGDLVHQVLHVSRQDHVPDTYQKAQSRPDSGTNELLIDEFRELLPCNGLQIPESRDPERL